MKRSLVSVAIVAGVVARGGQPVRADDPAESRYGVIVTKDGLTVEGKITEVSEGEVTRYEVRTDARPDPEVLFAFEIATITYDAIEGDHVAFLGTIPSSPRPPVSPPRARVHPPKRGLLSKLSFALRHLSTLRRAVRP